MTKIKIDQLIWDQWNLEHIKKHNVLQQEVEEVIERVQAHRKGYSGRIFLIGRAGTRILAVLLEKEKDGKYYIVTARDADRKERKLLYAEENKKNS